MSCAGLARQGQCLLVGGRPGETSLPQARTPTHIGHKAGQQCLLEHRVPVHVGQVGCILNITKAGQAALGVLGQELWTQDTCACLSCAPSKVSGALRAESQENEGASACHAPVMLCPAWDAVVGSVTYTRLYSSGGLRGKAASARSPSKRLFGQGLDL